MFEEDRGLSPPIRHQAWIELNNTSDGYAFVVDGETRLVGTKEDLGAFVNAGNDLLEPSKRDQERIEELEVSLRHLIDAASEVPIEAWSKNLDLEINVAKCLLGQNPYLTYLVEQEK